MVLVSGIMFLIVLTQIVQLAYSKSVSKDCSCFQTMTYLHDSATFWCINTLVVIMLNLYKDVYTCICMCICVPAVHIDIHVHERKSIKLKDFQHSALFLLEALKKNKKTALHSKKQKQNNLFGIIDIGAHKPWWLHVPFARFYIFHV